MFCASIALYHVIFIIVLELHVNLQLHLALHRRYSIDNSIISTLPHWSQPIQINKYHRWLVHNTAKTTNAITIATNLYHQQVTTYAATKYSSEEQWKASRPHPEDERMMHVGFYRRPK